MKFTAVLAFLAFATTITASEIKPRRCPHNCPRDAQGNCTPCEYETLTERSAGLDIGVYNLSVDCIIRWQSNLRTCKNCE
ncbi:hypothetical protein Vi05172_g5947 [Venturia inaequalis]|nr:hypothetical protein Vi05172_g5947 [Venturia inaequalis]